MSQTDDGAIKVDVARGLRVPPGGIAVAPPLTSVRTATLNGRPVSPNVAGEIIVRVLPVKLVIRSR
jgi:hypothetical protein